MRINNFALKNANYKLRSCDRKKREFKFWFDGISLASITITIALIVVVNIFTKRESENENDQNITFETEKGKNYIVYLYGRKQDMPFFNI